MGKSLAAFKISGNWPSWILRSVMFVRVGATAYSANLRMSGDRSSRPVALLVSHDFMASVTYVDVICSLHVSTHTKKVFVLFSWMAFANNSFFEFNINCFSNIYIDSRFSRSWFFKKHKFPNFLLRIHILRAYNCIWNCLGIFRSGCFQQCCCGCYGVWRRLIEGKLVLRS